MPAQRWYYYCCCVRSSAFSVIVGRMHFLYCSDPLFFVVLGHLFCHTFFTEIFISIVIREVTTDYCLECNFHKHKSTFESSSYYLALSA